MFMATRPRAWPSSTRYPERSVRQSAESAGTAKMFGTAYAACGSRSYPRQTSTLDFHAAEATYVDATVFTTAPWAAPLFQLRHFSWAVVDKVIHDILLTQPVSACYRIVKMVVKAVMILRDSSRAAFGSNGMAAHWVHFEISAILALGFACAAAIAARNPAPPAPIMARSA